MAAVIHTYKKRERKRATQLKECLIQESRTRLKQHMEAHYSLTTGAVAQPSN